MSGEWDYILEHYEYKDQEFEFNSEVNEKTVENFWSRRQNS